MPDGSPMAKIRETVKSAVRELIERHDEAVREGMTDQEHHWLCQTGNFHLFVDRLTPQTTEREIRRLADSQPHLFREIFDQAVRHIGAEEDIALIRDRLFDLIEANDEVAISAITIAELYSGMSDKRRAVGKLATCALILAHRLPRSRLTHRRYAECRDTADSGGDSPPEA